MFFFLDLDTYIGVYFFYFTDAVYNNGVTLHVMFCGFHFLKIIKKNKMLQ